MLRFHLNGKSIISGLFLISIHPMLRFHSSYQAQPLHPSYFNTSNVTVPLSMAWLLSPEPRLFQYIQCYGSIWMGRKTAKQEAKFQYIQCYGSIGLYRDAETVRRQISIHPMLRFHTSGHSSSGRAKSISIHPMLRFHVGGRCRSGFNVQISIHPMLRFHWVGARRRQRSWLGFQYIQCYGSIGFA